MDGRDFDITYTAGAPLGRRMRPEQRPPAAPPRRPGCVPASAVARMAAEEFVLHGTITGRMPSDDQGVRPVPALVQPWVHGVPPMRPAENRGTRRPSAGGRRFDDIFLAESESYAGEVDLHFERRTGAIISLTMTDFLNLQAAVTNPAKPVTARQAAQFLTELAASFPPDGFGSAESREAVARVLKMLGEG